MMEPEKLSLADAPADRIGRRIVFFGAGPLPASASASAPGIANRLWNFLQPALNAGHDCLVFSIESGVPSIEEGGGQIEIQEWRDRTWQKVRVTAEDCLAPERLGPLIRNYNPELCVGAGTILASWSACAVAGDRVVWADLFGDPLAEIQAKAAILGAEFALDEHLHVWRLQLDVLRRADAFSVVSRRQADALLGQFALAGRLGGNLLEQTGPTEMFGSRSMIHTIPCSLERLDFLDQPAPLEPFDRSLWLLHHGLPEDARIALWSGGFNAWVDVPTLVHGLEEALERDARLYLVVTGGGLPGYLERVYQSFLALTAASRLASRILPLGWLPLEEANGWLRAADVGLLVDRPCAETRLGARNRLLYYAAARCPVVASRGSEVVADMEAVGALVGFDPGDARELARRLHLLLNDSELRQGLGRLSYQYCEQQYLFEQSAHSFLAFIESPRRAEARGGASEWINGFLDFTVRQADNAELARYRSGRLSRLKSKLMGQ